MSPYKKGGRNMNTMMVLLAVVATAAGVFAGPDGPGGGRGCGGGGCRPCGPGGWGRGPGGCRPCGPGWGHRPPPPPHCRPGGWWGRGGCNFWPGFIGGVVGGLACNAVAAPYYRETVVVQSTPTVVTQPVVVQQPVVVSQPVVATPVTQTQNVWVAGRYVDTVQANGTVVRTWSPGHYESQTVVVQ